jgi:cytochrome c-type biogenesis protein CcmE
MDKGKKLKLVLIGAGIVACMGFLLVVTLSGGSGLVYYYTVSEFQKLSGAKDGGIRINGKVEAGSILRRTTGMDVRFNVTDGRAVLPVEYHGVVPATFVEGADVVVEGGLRQDGVFEAKNLLAKCPSKYEAAAKRGEKNPHADARSGGT